MPSRRVDRIPPQNLDAERALLGAMLMSSSQGDKVGWTIDDIAAILPNAEAFYDADHATLYRVILAAHAQGEPFDLTLMLQRVASLPSAHGGWEPYLIQLAESFADWANAPFYARAVRDHWTRRRLIQAAHRATELAYDVNNDLDATVANVMSSLDGIEQSRAADVEPRTAVEVVRALVLPSRDRSNIVPVALGEFGFRLGGGFERAMLIMVGARPACGKTSLGLSLCLTATQATGGGACLFVSAEMPSWRIAQRLIAMHSQIPLRLIRCGEMSEGEFNRERNRAALELETFPALYVLDRVRDARAIAGQIRRAVRLHDIRMAVVDYLQLLTIAGDYAREDLRIQAMSKLFQATAQDCNIALVLLSQLNRASVREGRPPTLADLRESGSLEEDADIVILISKDKDADDDGRDVVPTTFHIAKDRQGETGKVLVQYRRSTFTYEALASEAEPASPREWRDFAT